MIRVVILKKFTKIVLSVRAPSPFKSAAQMAPVMLPRCMTSIWLAGSLSFAAIIIYFGSVPLQVTITDDRLLLVHKSQPKDLITRAQTWELI